jgi:hypothetical protein
MDDIIGLVFLIGVLFGLEIVAIYILIMSAIRGRQLVFVILCGVVATCPNGDRVPHLVDLCRGWL